MAARRADGKFGSDSKPADFLPELSMERFMNRKIIDVDAHATDPDESNPGYNQVETGLDIEVFGDQDVAGLKMVIFGVHVIPRNAAAFAQIAAMADDEYLFMQLLRGQQTSPVDRSNSLCLAQGGFTGELATSGAHRQPWPIPLDLWHPTPALETHLTGIIQCKDQSQFEGLEMSMVVDWAVDTLSGADGNAILAAAVAARSTASS